MLWALCSVPAPARAGGFAVPEIGTRKTAMGAMIGRPDDLSAVYHNPAGLVLSPGTNLYLNTGLSLIETRLRMRPWTYSEEFIDTQPDAEGFYPEITPSRAFAVIPMITASTNLWTERLALALSLYVPNAAGAAFPKDEISRYHLVDSYVVAGYATLALAYRVLPWLSVGAGLNLIYMRLHAMRYFFPVLDGQRYDWMFGKSSELRIDGSDFTAGGSLGLLFQPLPALSLGLVLISRSNIALQGPISLKLGPDSPGAGNTLEGTQSTSLVIPWTVQCGANYDIGRFVEVGAELRYYFYRAFKEQRTEIEGIDLIKELVTPKNYHDSWQISGGVKLALPPLPALELMLGMHYDSTPAPDNTVSAETPTFNHVGLHSGARYRLGRYRLSLTYARYFYIERETSESLTNPPSNFRASGGNNIITLVFEVHFAPAIGVAR
jgi:long-subunit fatty acid transport protein